MDERSKTREYLLCALFSILACVVSYFSGISYFLLLAPVSVIFITAKDTKIFLIPFLIATIFSLFRGQEVIGPELLIAFSILGISARINRVFITLRNELHGEAVRAKSFHTRNEMHVDFLKKLHRGSFSTNNNFDSDDILGNALFDLSVKLKTTAEEDKKRVWQISGINELNSIIRSTSDVSAQYNVLVSFIVKYAAANQAGLFVVQREGNESFLELKSCYAYEKHRIQQKRVELSSGLLGQCIQEKEMVYLKQIPRDYVHITSGLGLATPVCLVIIPIKYGEEILGAIEIASLTSFEPHHIEFLNRASEVIGGAIFALERNTMMKKMLDESTILSEELRTQQEETRQNMEELEATQEHLLRQSKEREVLQDELKKSREFLNLVIDSVPVPIFVKNRKHEMILVNQAVCDLNNLKRDEMLGKSDYDFFEKEQADIFSKAEDDIFSSKIPVEKKEKVNRHGKETTTIDKKLIIETSDGETFLVGINIELVQDAEPGSHTRL